MNEQDRNALKTIRRCVAAQRFELLRHFVERMDQRGMVWPDVLAVLDDPAGVRGDGDDEWGRPRWIIDGPGADGLGIEIVCVIDTDEKGNVTVFITLYWQDR